MINLTAAEIANFVYVDPTPADGMIAYTSIPTGLGIPSVRLVQHFATTEERDAFLATVPKSYRLKAAGPTQVSTHFNFYPNEATGAANESAIKRLRTFAKKFAITHRPQRLVNDQPSIDEVLAIVEVA